MFDDVARQLDSLVEQGLISPEGKTFDHSWIYNGFESPEDYENSLQEYSLRDSEAVRSFNESFSDYL
ncbi:hypothetical protein QJK47_03535 [Clostridioides difficile]|nr:hypothetical protein [Clostridioides difficile]